MARYYAAEDSEVPADLADGYNWRVYDRIGKRSSVLLDEEMAERDAWELNHQGPYRSEEEADEAADAQAPYWGEDA